MQLKRVLIVDSDNDFLKSVSIMLDGKYQTATATSLFEAMKVFADESADVILVDYELVGEGNVNWLKSVQGGTSDGNVPVIFLSEINERKEVMKALDLKPDWYILKPPTRTKLVEEIEKALEKPEQEDIAEPVDIPFAAESFPADVFGGEIDQAIEEVDALLAKMGY